MLNEHSRIVLTASIPSEGLSAGDVGTIVHVYPSGKAYEVEFFSLSGQTIAVATVDTDKLRPVADSDVTHARPLIAA